MRIFNNLNNRIFSNPELKSEYTRLLDAVARDATLIVSKNIISEIESRQKSLNEALVEFDRNLQDRVIELVRIELLKHGPSQAKTKK